MNSNDEVKHAFSMLVNREQYISEEKEYFEESVDSISKKCRLSLLDHFAGLAMQGELASQSDILGAWHNDYARLAEHSYNIAQSMIEERRKRHER